jgi:hypothetical protein
MTGPVDDSPDTDVNAVTLYITQHDVDLLY